jgi:hypothetical protein
MKGEIMASNNKYDQNRKITARAWELVKKKGIIFSNALKAAKREILGG